MNVSRHDRATAAFTGIRGGDLRYRPLYTSTYVLDELATLIVRRSTHSHATYAVERIGESPAFTILHPDADDFDAAFEQFSKYDNHEICFTDQMSAVLAGPRDIDHIVTFDTDDSHTLGFTVIPDDTGGA